MASAVISPTSTGSEGAGRPTYTLGDRWIRNDGVFELIRIEDGRYVFASDSRQEIHLTTDLVIAKHVSYGNVNWELTSPPLLTWPLRVGDRGSGSGTLQLHYGQPLPAALSWAVETYEDVTVPAGTFKAFRIAFRAESLASTNFGRGGYSFIGSIPPITYSVWYAPELRQFVKSDGYSSLRFAVVAIDPAATAPLQISIREPKDQAKVASDEVVLDGTTTGGKGIRRVTVTLNGNNVAVHEPSGEPKKAVDLKTALELREGKNVLLVTAVDAAGTTSQEARTLFYNPPPRVTLPSPGQQVRVTSKEIRLSGTMTNPKGALWLEFAVNGVEQLTRRVEGESEFALDVPLTLSDGENSVTIRFHGVDDASRLRRWILVVDSSTAPGDRPSETIVATAPPPSSGPPTTSSATAAPKPRVEPPVVSTPKAEPPATSGPMKPDMQPAPARAPPAVATAPRQKTEPPVRVEPPAPQPEIPVAKPARPPDPDRVAPPPTRRPPAMAATRESPPLAKPTTPPPILAEPQTGSALKPGPPLPLVAALPLPAPPPPPFQVKVSAPDDRVRFAYDNIALAGLVSGGKGVSRVVVTLNGQEISRLDDRTPRPIVALNLPVKLREGQNTLVVTATDADGAPHQEVRTVHYEKLVPLTINFRYPEDRARVTEPSSVVVAAIASSKGVARVSVTLNGMEVLQPGDPGLRDLTVVQRTKADASAASTLRKSISLTVPVTLREGTNVIVVSANEPDGTLGQAVRTITFNRPAVAAPAPPPPPTPALPTRWAVIVGVGSYESPHVTKLRYTVKDAEALYEVLTGPGGLKREHVLLLTDKTEKKPTLRNIKWALGTFLARSARKNDTVFIFFAGHGAPEVDPRGIERDGLAKYLVPADADPEDLYSTALPMDELQAIFGRMEAERVVAFLDACYSGAAGGRTFAAKTTRAGNLDDQFLERLTRSKGRAIITASRPSEVSIELEELQHGIFTYYLVEGLRGGADLNRDGIVTLQELYEYVEQRVTQKSRAAGGNQHPVMKGELEGALPIVRVGGR